MPVERQMIEPQFDDLMRYHHYMRTTLELDDDVVAAARELARDQRRSLGSVVSELVRRGLTPAQVETDGILPVIRVPGGTPAITPEMVQRAVDEE
jgi:hypothetical protein